MSIPKKINRNQSIKIRKATIDEINNIIEIQSNDGFSHVYLLTTERIKRLMGRGEIFYIAYHNKMPVGFFSLDFEIRAKLHFFSVKKNFQRKGIGKKLLQRVFEKSKKQGFKYIYIHAEKNSPLYSFLKKMGFEESGIHENRYKPSKHSVILNYYF